MAVAQTINLGNNGSVESNEQIGPFIVFPGISQILLRDTNSGTVVPKFSVINGSLDGSVYPSTTVSSFEIIFNSTTIYMESVEANERFGQGLVIQTIPKTNSTPVPVLRPAIVVPPIAKGTKVPNYSYSDLFPTYFVNPNTGDLSRAFDDQSVKNSIVALVKTNRFERFFNEKLAGDVTGKLFEQGVSNTASQVREQIVSVIQNYEPRVQLNRVRVVLNSDQKSMNVTISYTLLSNTIESELTVTLERLR